MILSELVKLYDRMALDEEFKDALPTLGRSKQNISFEVVLDRQGNLVDVQDAKVTKTLPPLKKGGKEKVVQVAREVIVPGAAHPSGSAATPRFLWDTSAYMLGYYTAKAKKKEKDKTKAREALFPAYRDYHMRFRDKYQIQNVGLDAVCGFLEKWNPNSIPEDIRQKVERYADNFGVFRIEGEEKYVFDSPDILAAWDREFAEEFSSAPRGDCLVTGEKSAPLAQTIETKIKLAGTSVGGGAISSFNAAAYESYGKEQTLNSPISIVAGFKSCNALNQLIANPKFHIKLAETTVVFWTEKKTESESVLSWIIGESPASEEGMDEVQLQRMKAFWNVVRRIDDPDAAGLVNELKTPFFMLGIEPNSARIVIRFWHMSTLGNLVTKLREHHDALHIEKPFASASDRLSMKQILKETVRDPKNIPPHLSGALLRSVIEGTLYPTSLFQLVLNRVNVSHADEKGKYRVGSKVTYGQASVIKAFLVRNKHKGELTMSLNTENKDPAYLLGRLFATLEKTQEEASGGVNAGVGDKFYSSASATPRIVFPTILDLFKKWIKKLEGERKGLAVIREKLVGEILDDIDSVKGFPANLTLEERGSFALGYYQQMRTFFAKKDEAESEAK